MSIIYFVFATLLENRPICLSVKRSRNNYGDNWNSNEDDDYDENNDDYENHIVDETTNTARLTCGNFFTV